MVGGGCAPSLACSLAHGRWCAPSPPLPRSSPGQRGRSPHRRRARALRGDGPQVGVPLGGRTPLPPHALEPDPDPSTEADQIRWWLRRSSALPPRLICRTHTHTHTASSPHATAPAQDASLQGLEHGGGHGGGGGKGDAHPFTAQGLFCLVRLIAASAFCALDSLRAPRRHTGQKSPSWTLDGRITHPAGLLAPRPCGRTHPLAKRTRWRPVPQACSRALAASRPRLMRGDAHRPPIHPSSSRSVSLPAGTGCPSTSAC